MKSELLSDRSMLSDPARGLHLQHFQSEIGQCKTVSTVSNVSRIIAGGQETDKVEAMTKYEKGTRREETYYIRQSTAGSFRPERLSQSGPWAAAPSRSPLG